jgi:NADH-quinone oxidoreductase subunit E
MNLKPATLSAIDEAITHYPEKRGASLPLLHLVQEDQGFISDPAIEWVAAKLGLQPINIYELVTFYPMFRRKPIGRRHIKVCRTLSCALLGGYRVCETFKKEFNCELNEVSPGGDVTCERSTSKTTQSSRRSARDSGQFATAASEALIYSSSFWSCASSKRAAWSSSKGGGSPPGPWR